MAALLVLLIMRLRFCTEMTLDRRPPRPNVTNVAPSDVAAEVEASERGYAAFLVGDSRKYSVSPAMTPADMAKKFPYNVDENRYLLTPGKADSSIQTAGLRLTASVRGAGSDQSLVLRIDNLTDRPIAYRVETRPERGTRSCRNKTELRHNALALEANGYVIRSECRHKRGKGLKILKVETVSLPELSYFYISGLRPQSLGLDSRSTDGHVHPGGVDVCNRSISAELASSLETGDVTWRDLIDFYARHPCKTYRFVNSYKAFSETGELRLPAVEAE
jgi:hypothetical protein